MSKNLAFIVIIVSVVIGHGIGKLFGHAAVSPPKPDAQQIESELIKALTVASDQINRRAPIKVDEETRLDRSEVGPGARLTYYYSLTNYLSRDIEPSWLQAYLKPEVKKGACANNKGLFTMQNGATFVYAYSGKDGMEIGRFAINKNDCI